MPLLLERAAGVFYFNAALRCGTQILFPRYTILFLFCLYLTAIIPGPVPSDGKIPNITHKKTK
jgi:hypothetical protein